LVLMLMVLVFSSLRVIKLVSNDRAIAFTDNLVRAIFYTTRATRS
jgi:hypothetical protein